MKNTPNNASAILRGEQRSTRFRYRHSVMEAAREVGIPASWIWSWLVAKRLKYQLWQRKLWVLLQAVQELFCDLESVLDAFYATGEHLTSEQAIRQTVERWPDSGERVYVKFRLPQRMKPASGQLDADVAACEEVTA